MEEIRFFQWVCVPVVSRAAATAARETLAETSHKASGVYS